MGRSIDERQQGQKRRGIDEEISSPARRQLVRHLRDRTGWVDVTDLADELAAASDGESAVRASETAPDPDPERRRYRIRLHHVDLPTLVDRGVIDWDRAGGTVRLTDRVATAPARSVERDAADEPEREITDPRRRTVLAIVDNAAPVSVTREFLARKLAAAVDTPSDGAIDRFAIQLHHCHLPKLHEAGFIRYDSEAGTVSYCGPSDLPTAQSAE